MVKHICKHCNFETERKSTYDLHVQSVKHIKKASSPTSTSDNQSISLIESTTNSQEENSESHNNNLIFELEYKLKMKDLEIQNIVNEYNLKLQMKELEIKHKDELITLLKQGKINDSPTLSVVVPKQTVTEENIQLMVVENKRPQAVIEENISQITEDSNKQSISIKKRLITNRSEAPTFEECDSKFFRNENFNKFVKLVGVGENEHKIIEEEFIKENHKESPIDNLEVVLKSFFGGKYETAKLPFYCSDKKRHILYIKTKNGWIKQTDENLKEFDKHILNLARCAIYSVQQMFNNTLTLFKEHRKTFLNLYKINYQDWIYEIKPDFTNKYSLAGGSENKSGRFKDEDFDTKVIKYTKIFLSAISRELN